MEIYKKLFYIPKYNSIEVFELYTIMAYYDKYGAEYSDDKKDLIRVPVTHKGVYEIAHGTEYVSFDAFKDCTFVTTIIIPSTLSLDECDCEFGVLDTCKQLSYFYVLPENKDLFSIDGVLYQRNRWAQTNGKENSTILIAYPPAKKERFYLPNDILISKLDFVEGALWCTPSILSKLDISESHPVYTLLDGVLYDKKIDTLLKIPVEYKGEYKMPDSISTIAFHAFRGCGKLKTIIFGESLRLYAPVQGDMTLHEQLQDCHALSEVLVHPNNRNYVELNGFIIQDDQESVKEASLEYYIPPKGIKTVVIPDYIDYVWQKDVFALCNNIRKFSGNICGIIEKDVFVNTAFYKNENNWKNEMLYIDDMLIKVSEEYNKEVLVIPPKSRIITADSINCDSIKTIIVSEGVRDFNSEAINCKNLKTIKFPTTINNRYLDNYCYSKFKNCIDHFIVEKILIPKGYRDFFLMYIGNVDNIYEYDDNGDEWPIEPLSEEERNFYSNKHLNGFPSFKQYSSILREFQKKEGLSVSQIHTIAFQANTPEAQKFSMMDLRDMMWYLKKCFNDNGHSLKSLHYKDEKRNTDKIYYLD